MRRSKGMTFVEVITAMLVTLIIGGSSALFLKSGLDMEQANTISATNQQSLRTPFLELTPLVERAGALEILATLPAAASLQPSEVVAYIADPKDSTNLTADQNNLYLRTRSGDKLVPGFSQIAGCCACCRSSSKRPWRSARRCSCGACSPALWAPCYTRLSTASLW